MQSTIHIGKSDSGPVTLDVGRLIKTRMLVTANSGGGKSWLLRLLFEQLGQSTQLIVLDREGEFVTLREKLDVLLVGPLGEIPTDVRSAGLLVRRLMERRISAVIDMGELPLGQQRRYVRLFLEAMIGLPKELWHPCFVGLDETHLFCPEKGAGEAESTESVVNLATLGRKRGFCPIFATQRISKFHKDAAAELGNKFIGRTTLDVDQKRAADELGITKEEGRGLRDMSPPGHEGEFYGFGPAIDLPGVTRFRVGKVSTTHPEAGQGRTIEPPKPSRAIAAVLGELKDLPQQATEESKTLDDAKRTIADLKRQLNAKPVAAPDHQSIDRAVQAAVAANNREWERALKDRERIIGDLTGRMSKAASILHVNGEAAPKIAAPEKSFTQQVKRIPEPAPQTVYQSGKANPPADGLTKRQQRFLDAAATLMTLGAEVSRETVCGWIGVHPRGGSVGEELKALEEAGYIVTDRGAISVTEAGQSAAGDVDPAGAIESAKSGLSPRQAKFFEVICSAYPSGVTREQIAAEFEIHPRGGSLGEDLGRLIGRGLVQKDRGEYKARDFLFAGR